MMNAINRIIDGQHGYTQDPYRAFHPRGDKDEADLQTGSGNQNDRVTLSKDARRQQDADQAAGDQKGSEDQGRSAATKVEEPEDLKKVEELKARDREVRSHEMAHVAAGGGVTRGGPVYELEKGPDGKTYATGGHVAIDLTAEKDPQATVAKMQRVRRAAMAPAQPSSQDRAVAAKASQIESRARAEVMTAVLEKAAPAKHHQMQKAANLMQKIQEDGAEPTPKGQLIQLMA